MVKFKFFIFSICFHLTLNVHAKVDSSYIQPCGHQLVLKPFLDYKLNRLFVQDDITGGNLNYQTHQTPVAGIGGAYSWLNVLVGISRLDFLNSNIKEGSRNMDFQSNIYLQSIGFDVRYQRYDSYFLSNSEDLSNYIESKERYYRKDLSVRSYGTSLWYQLNGKRYSQKAVFSQNQRQLKSAGSLSVGTRFNYLSISADSSILPTNYQPGFVNFDVDAMDIYDYGLGVGYSYSHVYKNWFFNLSFTPWLTYQFLHVSSEENSAFNKLYSVQIVLQSRGGIGYNGKYDFCGIVFVYDQMRSRWRNAHDIGYDFGNIKIFYARRFNIHKV